MPHAARSGNAGERCWTAELPAALAELRLVSRQTRALVCGHPGSVESFVRHLYLAGLPRNRVFADSFLTRSI